MIGNYTYEEYENALKTRANSILELLNKIESKPKDFPFPLELKMLGFPILKVASFNELKIRLSELCDCLHLKLEHSREEN